MKSLKFKIYLCDFVHNYLGMGTYIFPLNIGYIASYAKKFFPKEIDIKLFKYPDDFITQFRKNASNMVGFSHYNWNADLGSKISGWVKSISPETIVVFGGPNINYSPSGYRKFFTMHGSADFFVPYQGETAFVNLLREIIGNGSDLSALRHRPIEGVISYDKDSDSLIQGRQIPRIKNVNSIPSPYLTGLLDEFFDTRLIPIMETNRGCPYSCTFCAQGMSSHNQIDFFNLERVKDEIKYIGSKVRNTNILSVADSNFGIVERDMEIARFIAKLRDETGYPRRFSTNLAKNQPRLFEIAKILSNCNLVISLQSLDETVLKNVKRSNIKLSVFKDNIDKVNELGGVSGSELILGLDGETKESHTRALRQLFDWNVSYIICYNIVILDGTQMALDKETGKLKCKTKFRLVDNFHGKYDDILSFEVEEGIRSTSNMSEEEILYFRPVHWLIQFLWNYRFYFDLLKYLKSLQINPLDYIIRLIENADDAATPEKVRKIFNEFKQDAEREWFESPEAVRDYYSRPEQFKLLKEGQYGKLNYIFVGKVLFEAKEDFEKYLYQTAVNYSDICRSREPVFKNILNFLSTSIIDFIYDWDDICKERDISCNYDILEWRNSRYKKALEKCRCTEAIKYCFYLPEDQRQSLTTLLRQYRHDNREVTLRKMSEYMLMGDLFYKLK